MVATASGELLRWDQGSAKPQWRVGLSGIKSGPGSPIALLAQLRDGDILIVERHGRVLRINPADPTKVSAKAAMMQWMRLKVDFTEADPNRLRDQLMAIDAPGAAFLDEKEKIFLASSHEPVVFRVDPTGFFGVEGSLVPVADLRRTFYKDNNFVVVSRQKQVPYAKTFSLPTEDRGILTAIAVCSGGAIVGTDSGSVFVLPGEESWRDGRMRDLAQDDEKPIVLDAGCLTGGIAFTIVSPETGKQIQLWDLDRAIELHSVDDEGGPLYTYSGVASVDGKRVLSVSDLGLRVWSVENRQLTLLGKQFLQNTENTFSAGALADGGFMYWDGGAVWSLSSDGRRKSWFAGSRK